MTDLGSSRADQDTSRAARAPSSRSSGWSGWLGLAAFLLILNGVIQMLEGFMALVNPDYYHVTSSGLAVSIDYSAWGWVHLVLGAVLFASGLGITTGNLAARMVAVLFASLNAVTALVFIEAAPGWGIVLITVDVLVIYALTVHGRELDIG